jgi:transposase-like protein
MSAAARSLSIGKVMRMSDQGAENVFARLHWPTTDGKPVCPDCDCTTCYDCHRGAYSRWRCKACGCDFSVTSGTLFAWRKLPLKTYLLSIVVFCNEVKGKSMLALSRDLDVQFKTTFVLAHKVREATASALRGLTIGSEGKVAEIDGASHHDVDAGHEVLLVSPPGPYGEKLRTQGFRWEPAPMERSSLNPLAELALLFWLWRLARTEKPQVMHGFTIKCAVYGALIGRFAGAARVNAVAGMGYVFISNEPKARLLRPIVRLLMRLALGGKRARLISAKSRRR